MDRKIWNTIVKENMDISDRRTLKCMTSINEADQDQFVASLAARIYDSIIKKLFDLSNQLASLFMEYEERAN